MMKKSGVWFLVLAALSLGLNACACKSFPEKLVYSPGLQKQLDKLELPIAIVVSKKGEIAAYDQNGHVLQRCAVPSKEMKDGKDLKPCPGFDDNRTVIFKQNLKIVGSKGSPYCIVVMDALGRAWTYCVDVP
jgi:hypothetical protein